MSDKEKIEQFREYLKDEINEISVRRDHYKETGDKAMETILHYRWHEAVAIARKFDELFGGTDAT